jgi:hypothetical protein
VRDRAHTLSNFRVYAVDRVRALRTKPGPPMSLRDMRENGVRAVVAPCESCNRSADVNVDALPETTSVRQAGRRLRCSGFGSKTISTRPAWHTGPQQGFRPRP